MQGNYANAIANQTPYQKKMILDPLEPMKRSMPSSAPYRLAAFSSVLGGASTGLNLYMSGAGKGLAAKAISLDPSEHDFFITPTFLLSTTSNTSATSSSRPVCRRQQHLLPKTKAATSPLPDVGCRLSSCRRNVASMQAAVLQAEKQDNIKSIRFPTTFRPEPTGISDLQRLATSLADALATILAASLTRESILSNQERDAKLHAESLAAQGLQFGPFADYAALVRQLQKKHRLIPTVLQTKENAPATLLRSARHAATGSNHTSAAKPALFRSVKTQ